jgi:hypothetical protein
MFCGRHPGRYWRGANRLLLDRVFELFSRVRRDCDATAQDLDIKSPDDDGLAAVKFLAETVWAEAKLEIQKRDAAEKPRRKRGPHKSTEQLLRDWKEFYPNEKKRQLASKADITKWIANLEQHLAGGHAESPAEAVAIRKLIGRLGARRDAPGPKKTIKQVRAAVAKAFVESGLYGEPRGEFQDAETYIAEKLKRARRSIRKASRKRPKGSTGVHLGFSEKAI